MISVSATSIHYCGGFLILKRALFSHSATIGSDLECSVLVGHVLVLHTLVHMCVGVGLPKKKYEYFQKRSLDTSNLAASIRFFKGLQLRYGYRINGGRRGVLWYAKVFLPDKSGAITKIVSVSWADPEWS